jgi:hypothetical protein
MRRMDHLRTRVSAGLPWLLVALLVALDLVLAHENKTLKRASALPDDRVPPGRILHAVGGPDLEGRFRPLAMPGRGGHLLVITFSPVCPACRRDQPFVSYLAASVGQKPGWSVAWVSRDRIAITKAYCQTVGIPPGAVFANVTYPTYVELGMRFVPQIIVVGPFGKVARVWRGELTGPRRRAVLRYLAVGSSRARSSGSAPVRRGGRHEYVRQTRSRGRDRDGSRGIRRRDHPGGVAADVRTGGERLQPQPESADARTMGVT